MKTIAYYKIAPVYQEDLDAQPIKLQAIGIDLVTGEFIDTHCAGGFLLSIQTYEALLAFEDSGNILNLNTGQL